MAVIADKVQYKVKAQTLLNALVPLIHDALSGDPEVARTEKAAYFSFADIGGLILSHAEAANLREASALLCREFPKVSSRTCDHELHRFCCRFIPQLGSGVEREPIARALPEFLDHLQSLSDDSTTVYVEVCGLDLQVPEWFFGPARFLKGDHPDVEADHSQIVTLDGRKPDALKPDQIVAQIKVVGEVEYAGEQSAKRVADVLDVIQFLSLSENPGSWEPDGLCFGLYCCEPIPPISSNTWTLTSRGPTWTSSKGIPPIIVTVPAVRCILNEETHKRFAERGGIELSSILMEASPSAFDQNLLTGITWVGNAIRERNLARKYLGYYVGIEALFGRDRLDWRETEGFQAPIVPIAEGVAFLLGQDVDDRRRLSMQMNDLAKTRNRIIHRGYTVIDETDLRILGSHAWNCCRVASSKRNEFCNEDSFRDWLLNCKFGNADS